MQKVVLFTQNQGGGGWHSSGLIEMPNIPRIGEVIIKGNMCFEVKLVLHKKNDEGYFSINIAAEIINIPELEPLIEIIK